MFERSFKLHSKKGAPASKEVIFQFQREGSAFIIDVDMEQKLDYPLGLSPSDNYRLSITVHNTFYLHIFQINSENIPVKLFPGEDPGSQNPLETGKNYYLPGEKKWYFLDEQKGEEQLYICISEQDIPELEEYYSQYYKTRSATKKEKILTQLINKLAEEESNYFLIENQ